MTLRKSIALLFAFAMVVAACGDDDAPVATPAPAPPQTVVVTSIVEVEVPGDEVTVTSIVTRTSIVEVEVTVPPAEPMEMVDMSVFATPFTDSAQVWMGLSQGFYEDAGLDVQVRSFSSGSQALTAFRSGAGDVLQLGELPAMTYWTQTNDAETGKGDITVLGGVSNTSAGYVIVADADILTAADLAGKKIGLVLGSTNEFFLDQYLKANAMTMDQVENRQRRKLRVGRCHRQRRHRRFGDLRAVRLLLPRGPRVTRFTNSPTEPMCSPDTSSTRCVLPSSRHTPRR